MSAESSDVQLVEGSSDTTRSRTSTRSSRGKGWKDVDLTDDSVWGLAETQNIYARATLSIQIGEQLAFREDFQHVWDTEFVPLLDDIENQSLVKTKRFEELSNTQVAEIEKAVEQFEIYRKGPSESTGNGEEWVRQHCAHLNNFLHTYCNVSDISESIYDQDEHMLDVIHLGEVLLDIFGYTFARDIDVVRANGVIDISLGHNPRDVLENIADEVGRLIEKRFVNSIEREYISYTFRITNPVVANTEKVSSTFGLCSSTRKIIISNPVSGEVAPFLTLSPKKVEKYVLRKGKAYSRAMAPHCRAAFSYNDLSSNHKGWIDDKNMKVGELPKGWDVEQTLQPMSLHKVQEATLTRYDDVAVDDISKTRESNGGSFSNGNGKDGPAGNAKSDQSYVGGDGVFMRRDIEEAILSMQIGEISILKLRDLDSSNGNSKFVQVRNEGFVEGECGTDCCGLEEGVLLLTEHDISGYQGIGEYQACKICYAGCTCQSCKSLIKCLLSCSACFAGCGVVVADSL